MIVAISRASSSFGMRGLSVREPRAAVGFCALDSAVARFVFLGLGTM